MAFENEKSMKLIAIGAGWFEHSHEQWTLQS